MQSLVKFFIVFIFSGLGVFFGGEVYAGIEGGNTGLFLPKNSDGEVIKVSLGGKHPLQHKIIELIDKAELPRALKQEMLIDLQITSIISTNETVKYEELLKQITMQLVGIHRTTENAADGTTKEVITEDYVKKEMENRLGLCAFPVDLKTNNLNGTFVAALSTTQPKTVLYFTKFVEGRSDEEVMELVLHEQAHRLNAFGERAHSERWVMGWAAGLVKYLNGQTSKDDFYAMLKQNGIPTIDRTGFPKEENTVMRSGGAVVPTENEFVSLISIEVRPEDIEFVEQENNELIMQVRGEVFKDIAVLKSQPTREISLVTWRKNEIAHQGNIMAALASALRETKVPIRYVVEVIYGKGLVADSNNIRSPQYFIKKLRIPVEQRGSQINKLAKQVFYTQVQGDDVDLSKIIAFGFEPSDNKVESLVWSNPSEGNWYLQSMGIIALNPEWEKLILSRTAAMRDHWQNLFRQNRGLAQHAMRGGFAYAAAYPIQLDGTSENHSRVRAAYCEFRRLNMMSGKELDNEDWRQYMGLHYDVCQRSEALGKYGIAPVVITDAVVNPTLEIPSAESDNLNQLEAGFENFKSILEFQKLIGNAEIQSRSGHAQALIEKAWNRPTSISINSESGTWTNEQLAALETLVANTPQFSRFMKNFSDQLTDKLPKGTYSTTTPTLQIRIVRFKAVGVDIQLGLNPKPNGGSDPDSTLTVAISDRLLNDATAQANLERAAKEGRGIFSVKYFKNFKISSPNSAEMADFGTYIFAPATLRADKATAFDRRPATHLVVDPNFVSDPIPAYGESYIRFFIEAAKRCLD